MNSGFTLLEVVVSLALLGTVSLLLTRSLIGRNETIGASREQFIATSLAREGLELVRAVRDTNWFSQEPDWTANLCDLEPDFVLDARMIRAGDPPEVSNQAELFKTAEGEWVHEASDEATGYHRRLTIDCAEKDADPQSLTVVSEVTWESQGQPKSIELKEKLFNWLPTP